MNTLIKNIVFWALIIIAVLVFYKFLSSNRPDQVELTFSQMLADVEAGRVAKVTITGSEIVGEYAHPGPDSQTKNFVTIAPMYDDLVKGNETTITETNTHTSKY